MTNNYDKIINLPHHISPTRPQMPVSDRAAQFSPFAALTGYDAAVKETARLTDQRVELEEDEKATLDEKLRLLIDLLPDCPEVQITYFQPDQKKSGGAYVLATGFIKKLDEIERVLIMTDNTKIPMDQVSDIESECFHKSL